MLRLTGDQPPRRLEVPGDGVDVPAPALATGAEAVRVGWTAGSRVLSGALVGSELREVTERGAGDPGTVAVSGDGGAAWLRSGGLEVDLPGGRRGQIAPGVRRVWLADAALAWQTRDGVARLRVLSPPPKPGAGTEELGQAPLGTDRAVRGRILDAAGDAHGGIRALVSTPSTLGLSGLSADGTLRSTPLVAGGTPRSGAVASGTVAYLARGRAGRPDVRLRRLTGAGRDRAVTRTRAAERSVEDVSGGSVLYRRGTDLLLDGRRIARGDRVSHGRLVVVSKELSVVAWLRAVPAAGGTLCTQVMVRTVSGARLGPTRRVADCAVTTSE